MRKSFSSRAQQARKQARAGGDEGAQAHRGREVRRQGLREMATAAAGCKESADHFALDLLETFLLHACSSERSPNAREMADPTRQGGVHGGDRVAEDRWGLRIALFLETLEFAFLRVVGGFHDAQHLTWFRAAVLLLHLTALSVITSTQCELE